MEGGPWLKTSQLNFTDYYNDTGSEDDSVTQIQSIRLCPWWFLYGCQSLFVQTSGQAIPRFHAFQVYTHCRRGNQKQEIKTGCSRKYNGTSKPSDLDLKGSLCRYSIILHLTFMMQGQRVSILSIDSIRHRKGFS
jgi:hypothetical protein